MFGGSTTLNTNKPNPFDDDSDDDEGEGIAMFGKKRNSNSGGEESNPNPFDDSDSEDDGMMTDSLIKAGQDTALSCLD